MSLAIILVCCALVWLSMRFQTNFDLTQSGRYSLSRESINQLQNMPADLSFRFYFNKEFLNRTGVENLLKQYQRLKNNVYIEMIDIDDNPDLLRRMKIRSSGELRVGYNKRVERLSQFNEKSIGKALKRLIDNSTHKLYFITGHGERDLYSNEKFAYSQWLKELRRRGYEIHPINLATEPFIPKLAKVIIIAGPKQNFLEGEVENIQLYLEQGGNLLWLQDYMEAGNLEFISEDLGFSFMPGMLADNKSLAVGLPDPHYILISDYTNLNLREDFSETTLFPSSGALELGGATEWEAKPFLTSNASAWLESDSQQAPPFFDAGLDLNGPHIIGAQFSRQKEVEAEAQDNQSLPGQPQRAIVISDSDFLSNQYLNASNLTLSLRVLDWLTHEDNLSVKRSRPNSDLVLQLSSGLKIYLDQVNLILLPALFLLLGLVIGFMRNRKA